MQFTLFATDNTSYLLPIVREQIKALQEVKSVTDRDVVNVIRDVVSKRCPELQFKQRIELVEKIKEAYYASNNTT